MSDSESGRSGKATATKARWRVEFTQSAATDVRTLPAVVRNALAEVFDAMSSGPPADAVQAPADHAATDHAPAPARGWSVATRSGHIVRFTLRQTDRIILVFGVEAGSDPVRAARPRLRVGLPEAAQEFLDETRFALRGLRRAPAFTLGVILTLAVGMGGASTIFGLVHTVFRGALPFEDDAQVVRIRSRTTGSTGEVFAFNVTPRDFELVRDGNRVFEGVAAQQGSSISLVGEGAPERASVIGVSKGWAGLLGLRPYLGRAFTADEEALGEEAGVALISHSLWQSRFGGDPSAVGEDLAYDGGRMRIVGVMAPRFAYPYDAQVWTPWRADGTDWTSSDLNVVARLMPGVDLATASADVDRVYVELKRESPGTTPNEGFQVATSRDDLIRTEAAALQSLALAVLFLLILVCVNVANLFVARRVGQRREFAVRAALGAGRGRLSRAAVLESVIVFATGAVLGLALVVPLGSMASVLIPETLRSQADLASVRIGLPLIAFTLLIAMVAGALTGFLASRSNKRSDLQAVLRDGARGTSGSSGRLRDGLVIAELALSMMLLVGAGVLSDHFRRLQDTDLGFHTADVITAQVALQHERFDTEEARAQLVGEVEASIGALAGVEGVAVTSVNPLCCGDWGARVRIEGLERPAELSMGFRCGRSRCFSTAGCRSEQHHQQQVGTRKEQSRDSIDAHGPRHVVVLVPRHDQALHYGDRQEHEGEDHDLVEQRQVSDSWQVLSDDELIGHDREDACGGDSTAAGHALVGHPEDRP
jgi:predicted permease